VNDLAASAFLGTLASWAAPVTPLPFSYLAWPVAARPWPVDTVLCPESLLPEINCCSLLRVECCCSGVPLTH
jgi:hypothetical protein